METAISTLTQKFKDQWDVIEEKGEKVEEKAKNALGGGLEKLAKEKTEIVDIVVKAVEGEKKDYKGVGRPAFLAGMLLNEKSPAYFKVTPSDIRGGGGKIALWIRHFFLTHLRDKELEDKFLASLASTGKEGVEAVWKDVLAGLGVPPEERQEAIGKLVDETLWVALTLVKEKVREKALQELDAARGLIGKIRDDKTVIDQLAGKLKLLKSDGLRKAVLGMLGLKEADAEEICGLIAKEGKGAAGKIKAALKVHAAKVADRLDGIREQIWAMPLSTYDALLDFKPELGAVMKSAGQGKAKDDCLTALVSEAQKDAAIGRIARKTAEVLIEATAFVGFTILTGGIVSAGTPLLHEILWEAGRAAVHGAELSVSVSSESCDAQLLEQLGIGGPAK